MLATIPLDMIENGQRLRGISEATVASLVNSIGDIGLLNPVTVYRRQLYRGGNSVEGYGLIAGLHRKTACERLGLVEIEANILDLSDLECQIAECDENLCAPALSPSERAQFTKRRKDAYEALHPETKHGGNLEGGGVANMATPETPRFTADTAARTGQSERAVQRAAEHGNKIADNALALVHGTALDTVSYLDKLKAIPTEDQAKTVRERLAELRDASRPKPTLATVNKSKLDADIRQRAAKALAEIIAEYVPADAWDHFKSNLAVTTTKDFLTEFTNLTGQSIMDRKAS